MLTLGKLTEGIGELGTTSIFATFLEFIAKQQQKFF